MDFTPMLLCLIVFIINVEAFRLSTNGHQVVPEQKTYYEEGPVIVKRRKVSPNHKYTFSYKKTYRSGSRNNGGSGFRNGGKINILSYNDKNGVISIVPKSEFENGIRHRFSYTRARKELPLPQGVPEQPLALPQQTLILSEKSLPLTNQKQIVPEQMQVLPEQTISLPQQAIALPQQTIAGAKTTKTAPLSEMKILKTALTDSTSSVHQNLVSSIEKIIVDALGVENNKVDSKLGTKVVSVKKATKTKQSATEKVVAISKDKPVIKPKTVDKSATVLSNASKLESASIMKEPAAVDKVNSTVSKVNDKKAKESKAEKTQPTEPTEPVSAEAPTTPEPADAVINAPYPREQYCFCLSWCPPGTIYKGHCGQRWPYGLPKSICCLATFINEDNDSDYD